MGDDKLPRIPSFAELGISEDEIEELEREIAEESATRKQRQGAKGPGEGPPAPAGGEPTAASPAPAKKKGAESQEDRTWGLRRRRKPKAKPTPRPKSARKPKRTREAATPATIPADGPATSSAPAASPDTTATPAPWGGVRGPATLLFLLVTAWLSSSYRAIPAPVPASAPDSVFSSARAMTHLARIASEARPPGSPNHARARDYLQEELRALGHQPSVQMATSFSRGFGAPTVATVRNVLARIPGEQPGGPAVLVTAHYDSREIALGAADDGAGVVAILEAVRALGARPPLRNDLIVLITDAEEIGLLGARAFVDEHPWFDDVAVFLGIEMRGGGGPSLMFETGADNGWVIEALRRADPYPAANSVSYEIYRRMPNDTDFTPFREAGKQGLNFAAVGKPHVYHQHYDSPENLSEGTLQHHGEHLLAMMEHLGNADLSDVDAPDVSYIAVPFVGLVTYGPLLIRLLGAAAVAAWLAAFFVGLKRGARLTGMLVGLGASAVYSFLVWIGADQLIDWRAGAHPELGALHAGSFHSEGWYVATIVGGALALAAVISGVLRRWFTVAELAVGAMVGPVALAALATVMFPMAAMNLQWPALGGCVGAVAVAGLARDQRMGPVRWAVVLVATVPVLVTLTPLTEGVWAAMGIRGAFVPVLTGLLVVMLLPALDAMREPNGWWAPLAVAVAAGSFFAVAVSAARPSPDRPAPSTLVYALDRETGFAYWGTNPYRDDSDPGVAWATAALGPFAPPVDPDPLAEFGKGGANYALAPADPVELSPPSVTVVEDPALPGDVLRISVTSTIGAERLYFRIPEDGPRLVSVNGELLPEGASNTRLSHWGAPPEGGLILDFIRPPGDNRLEFVLVEHHLRPGELVGAERFTRPPELAPNVTMLSDRAMIRTVVSIGGPGDTPSAEESGVVDENDRQP